MLTAESQYLLQTHSIAISHVGYASKRICIEVRAEVDPKDIVSRIFNCPILKYHYLKELKIAHVHIYGEAIDPSTLKKYYDAAHYIQDEADKRYSNLIRILKGVKDFKEVTGIDVNLHVSSEHQNSFEMFDSEGQSLVKCGGGQQPLYGLKVQAAKNEITLDCKGFITSSEEEKKVEQIQIIVRPEHADGVKYKFESEVDIFDHLHERAINYSYNRKKGSFLITFDDPLIEFNEILEIGKDLDQVIGDYGNKVKTLKQSLPKEIALFSDCTEDKVIVNGEGFNQYNFPVNLDNKLVFLDGVRKNVKINILPETSIGNEMENKETQPEQPIKSEGTPRKTRKPRAAVKSILEERIAIEKAVVEAINSRLTPDTITSVAKICKGQGDVEQFNAEVFKLIPKVNLLDLLRHNSYPDIFIDDRYINMPSKEPFHVLFVAKCDPKFIKDIVFDFKYSEHEKNEVTHLVLENAVELKPEELAPLTDPKKIYAQREKFLKAIPTDAEVRISYDCIGDNHGFGRYTDVKNPAGETVAAQTHLTEEKVKPVFDRIGKVASHIGFEVKEQSAERLWNTTQNVVRRKNIDWVYSVRDDRNKG
ncbi:hypothetical protein WH47_09779 [Habropoda laboriosa]|uniref:Uncharacterized protein n=1 Tax=Habropoda laboriosa TaxID=597456 RepID=A0A0L7QIZ2_9HYME|nr:hypothetical protein WH47_09779 [Habropoda laboriosa]